jgi:hypothetical protein
MGLGGDEPGNGQEQQQNGEAAHADSPGKFWAGELM